MVGVLTCGHGGQLPHARRVIPPAQRAGLRPFSQPKKHGSCCHMYHERVRMGRSFTQMICWCTNAPCCFHTPSNRAWLRLACQQYHAASWVMATSSAAAMNPSYSSAPCFASSQS